MWAGAWEPKALGHFLAKIAVSCDVLAYFSFRQITPDSVGFSGLPSPYIFPNSDNMTCGVVGVRKPKFLGQFLAKTAVLSAVLSDFSFRQLPWASASKYFPIQEI